MSSAHEIKRKQSMNYLQLITTSRKTRLTIDNLYAIMCNKLNGPKNIENLPAFSSNDLTQVRPKFSSLEDNDDDKENIPQSTIFLKKYLFIYAPISLNI